ncbi:hypothetical protein GGF31_006244 [Allomyces arbusculus]|nr:hypothetical protein GGF31_006244 [Allomyces arbusculus]
MLDAAAAPPAAREDSSAANAAAASPNANAPITPALAAQAIMASTSSTATANSDNDSDNHAPPECLELAQLLLALRNGQHGHHAAGARPVATPTPTDQLEQLPPLAVALPCDDLPEPVFAVDNHDDDDDDPTVQLDVEEPAVLLPDLTEIPAPPPAATTATTRATNTPPARPRGDPRLVSYEEMIVAALTALPPPAPGTDVPPGHPPRAIFAWMAEHYALADPKFRGSATQALKKGWRKGRFLRSNRRYSVNPHYTAPLARGRSKPSAEGGLLHSSSTSASASSTPPMHSTLDDRAVAAAGVHSAAAALVELMAAAHGSSGVPPAASGEGAEDAEMEEEAAPEEPVAATPAKTARKRPRSASSRGAAGAGGTPRARRKA